MSRVVARHGPGMSDFEKNAIAVSRAVDAAPSDVWDVLSDGWLYPCWVVGAARMRDVDTRWPEKGSRLHHSVGNWPFLLDDKSEVLDVEPLRSLRLRAQGWPAGAAEVLIEIEDKGVGSFVTIREDAVEGPGALVPRPARQASIVPRNRKRGAGRRSRCRVSYGRTKPASRGEGQAWQTLPARV